MLKASAWDRIADQNDAETTANPYPYVTDYDPRSGWGHLQADRIYTMFNLGNTSGYRVSHHTVSGSQGRAYGNWSSWDFVGFVNGGKPTHYLQTDLQYFARKRVVTWTYTLPNASSTWDLNQELYVWGRSGVGPNPKGGFGHDKPNHQDHTHRKLLVSHERLLLDQGR